MGSNVLGSYVLGSKVPGSKVPGSKVPGSKVLGSDVWDQMKMGSNVWDQMSRIRCLGSDVLEPCRVSQSARVRLTIPPRANMALYIAATMPLN